MAPKISTEVWQKRIDAARRRREQYEATWADYCRLHTNVYTAVAAGNDDAAVYLPNGDQVKVGVVHRNVEQTLALLDVPEIGVRATAKDFTRELGELDTHREQVVEQAIYESMGDSGIVQGMEVSDAVKRDAIMVGHGISYTCWRLIEEEVDGDPIAILLEDGMGGYMPALDAGGQPEFEIPTVTRVLYEGVQDEYVSPLEFLFDANSQTIRGSLWHGMEKIVDLDAARANARYVIPDDIKGSSFTRRDLYGTEETDDTGTQNAVKIITIFDKLNRELLAFIEQPAEERAHTRNTRKTPPANRLIPILSREYPVRFDHPDDSPFSDLILIPANDRPFGISQVEHIRNQGAESDKMRTRIANLTRQIKRIIGYDPAVFPSEDTLRTALQHPDFSLVAMPLVGDGRKLSEALHELPLPTVHRELFAGIDQAEDDVRKTTGIAEQPYGGASTATESENMMAVGGARVSRKRRLHLAYLTQVARIHKAFLGAFAPPGTPIIIQQADGRPVALEYGREAFQGRFEIKVVAGGEATAVSPVRQKMLIEMSDRFLGKFGPKFDLVFLRQALTLMDIRDVNQLMAAAREGMLGAPAPGAPMPGQLPGQIPGANLNDYTDAQAIRAAINAPSEGAL